ncbi:MAG: hypothetical protein O7A07_06300, partial [Acidobacteria bacterium]|nr:hypothetical protein [Acidobacteriota bacterium]
MPVAIVAVKKISGRIIGNIYIWPPVIIKITYGSGKTKSKVLNTRPISGIHEAAISEILENFVCVQKTFKPGKS